MALPLGARLWGRALRDPERDPDSAKAGRRGGGGDRLLATPRPWPGITISPEQRERIHALSKDLPRLFRARTTKVSQKKEIVRLLIEDVTLTNQDELWGIDVAIRWRTG